MINNKAFTRGILLLALCLGVFALRETHRHFESFAPEVPRVHVRSVGADGVRFLDYRPTIESEDSLLIALNLAEQIVGYPVTYVVKSSHVSSNNVRHAYLKQTAVDGKEIFNADLNINVLNKVALNLGHTFYNGSTAPVTGTLDSIDAVNMLIAFLKIENDGQQLSASSSSGVDQFHLVSGVRGSLSPAQARSGYVQVELGTKLEPVWDVVLDMDLHWWNAHVSSRTGEVLAVYDWVSDSSYDGYPIGVNDPSDGARTVILNPAVLPGSPLGWHKNNDSYTFYTTIGNNVYAQSNPTGSSINWQNFPRPAVESDLVFAFLVNFAAQPVMYVNASTTNLFVWNNYIHDIFYNYGFTEAAGNFQENNFGRGGLGTDAVQANCQDGAGYNNANFATPVDGQRPRMRMYIWTQSNPYRDGDLDQGIIIHEYAHGITNRLTGGANNSNCLSSLEAGGMGEGWGDFFATLIRQRPEYEATDQFVMGDYSANKSEGIRMYPYTTNMKVNPETYGFINGNLYTGVHAKGEVWCGILWETYWNFVNESGFTPNLYTGVAGNTMILNNVVTALKLQPCNPSFVDARDAILLADAINYGGDNECLLWRGFAKRGLGLNAVAGAPRVKEDFTIPIRCM